MSIGSIFYAYGERGPLRGPGEMARRSYLYPRTADQRSGLPPPPIPRSSITLSTIRGWILFPLTSTRCRRFSSSAGGAKRMLYVLLTLGLYQPSYPRSVLIRPSSGESKRNDGSGNFGDREIPDSVNSRPISLLRAYKGQAWVCMLSTGKSVHPNGLPPVVSPGCLLEAAFKTSGPLHVPYQISGYTSAWRANEFFFHSSQAIAPSS